MADSLVGRALSGLSVMHMFERIPCMAFMLSDKLTESRSWMSPAPKDRQKSRRRSDTASSCIDLRRLLPEDVGRRVEEPRREVHVIIAQLAVLDRDDERRLVHFLLEVRLGDLVDQPRDERLAVVVSGDVRHGVSNKVLGVMECLHVLCT